VFPWYYVVWAAVVGAAAGMWFGVRLTLKVLQR